MLSPPYTMQNNKSKDVESLAVFKGQSVLHQSEDDRSSIDDVTKENAAASVSATKTRSASQPQPFWKRHKFLLLGVAAVGIAVAVALTATKLLKGGSETKNTSDKVSEVGDLVAESPPTSSAPTLSPSASPSVKPQWDIIYQGMNLDFSANSDHEIEIEYKIGIDRVYETEIFATDCITPIEGLNIDLTPELSPLTIYNELLTLKYKVDKSSIKGSNVWNDGLNRLQVCQVVRLLLPAEDENGFDWVITEDKRTLDIDISLEVNFGLGVEIPLASTEQGDAVTVASEGLDEIVNSDGS